MNWNLRYAVWQDSEENRAAFWAGRSEYYKDFPEKVPHGTNEGYSAGGCRCDDCSEAHSNYQKEYLGRIKETLESDPDHELHGTYTGYATGCRCDKCSSKATSYRSEGLAAIQADPDHPFHGTYTGYASFGCRCGDCKQAGKIQRKKVRSELLTILQADPEHPKHGTELGRAAGCKCPLCKSYADKVNAEYAEKRRDRRLTTSSWNKRYANSKIPSKCVFCNGSSHYFKTAKEVIKDENWSDFTPGQEGLPRKFWTETSSNFMHMKPMPKYAPVPYIQDPLANPDEEHAMKAITEHRCVFCGVPFKRDETVTRFTDSSPNVNSLQPAEYFPMHEKCMSTTRRFCPGLYNHPDEHFETGPYEQLRANAERQVL